MESPKMSAEFEALDHSMRFTLEVFWEHICNISTKLFAFQEKDENIDNGKHPEEEEVSVEMLKKNWN